MASLATNPTLKESLEDTAQQWIRLASELEATKRLLDEWGDPRFTAKADCVVHLHPRKSA
jgi:hypothetical protein